MPIVLAQADISKALYTCSFGDGDGKADASVKLGAADKTDVFVPNINALKWGNEAWVNLNPSWFAVGKSSVCDFTDRVAAAQVGDVLIKTWALNQSVLEYAVVFSSVPAQENIEMDILQSSGLDWWFQGELTEDDIKEGCVRPDRVVGSYALYFNKSCNDYRTGKFAHLFRWECIAADGQKAWCGHLYKDGNKLIIPLPVDWLKKAKYPVICMGAGDTFGFTSVGGTATSLLAEGVGRGTYASPASNGTVKSVAFWTTSGTRNYKVALYTAAGDLVSAQNTGVMGTADAWNTMSVPDAAISSGTTYISLCKRDNTTYLYYDELVGGAGYASNAYSTDWPATLSFTNTDRKYSIYANYEPAAGTKVPVFMHHYMHNLGR